MSSEEQSSLYEIVELDNGDIALSRVDGKGEPLVTIHFSAESLFFLDQSKFAVARAMIEAGLDVVAEIGDTLSEAQEIDGSEPIIH